MINQSIFKAYDIRGKYPQEINERVVFEIASALGRHFGKKSRLLVGCDGRLSSPSLYKAVLKGVKSPAKGEARQRRRMSNVKCIEAGLMTTPMLYFLVSKLEADGGIMVTASHNPKEYNGLKVVGPKAKPISGSEIFKLMDL